MQWFPEAASSHTCTCIHNSLITAGFYSCFHFLPIHSTIMNMYMFINVHAVVVCIYHVQLSAMKTLSYMYVHIAVLYIEGLRQVNI